MVFGCRDNARNILMTDFADFPGVFQVYREFRSFLRSSKKHGFPDKSDKKASFLLPL